MEESEWTQEEIEEFLSQFDKPSEIFPSGRIVSSKKGFSK
jgi:hypothetical protein